MQSITQKYLKNEYLPINYGKKYGVRDFGLLNSNIRSTMPNKFVFKKILFVGDSIFSNYFFENLYDCQNQEANEESETKFF